MQNNAEPRAMKVSVIIATLHRYEEVCRTIGDLLKSSIADLEIVVSDQNDCWPEGWIETMKNLRTEPRVLWLELGLIGVVRARNMAVEASSGDLLVFVDDDVLIGGPDFLEQHVRVYDDATISAVSGRELDAHNDLVSKCVSQWWLNCPSELDKSSSGRLSGNPLQQCLSFDRQGTSTAMDVCFFCTCNASILRRAFLDVGGFDEQFRGNSYGDDYDLAMRLQNEGHRLVYRPGPVLIHLRSPMGGLRVSDPRNPFTHQEKAYSRWLFYYRYKDYGQRRLLLKQVLRNTIFVKANLKSPLAFIAACVGSSQARSAAKKNAGLGPESIFTKKQSAIHS